MGQKVRVTQKEVGNFLTDLRKALKENKYEELKFGIQKNNLTYNLLIRNNKDKFPVRTLEIGFLTKFLSNINIQGNKIELTKKLTNFINKNLEGLPKTVFYEAKKPSDLMYFYELEKYDVLDKATITTIDTRYVSFMFVENLNAYTKGQINEDYNTLIKYKKDLVQRYVSRQLIQESPQIKEVNMIEIFWELQEFKENMHYAKKEGLRKEKDIVEFYKNETKVDISDNYGYFLIDCCSIGNRK